jgi:tetraacyldisaccharide 4'-kinase
MKQRLPHIYPALRPLAFLYGLGVRLRNRLFDRGILTSKSFDTPVLCVGNLTVGGTGKTPHTEYLIRLLQQEFRVAVLSRGYKRKSKGYLLADAQTPMAQLGDEPYQMKHKFPAIQMAVDADRCHGIEQLTQQPAAQRPEVILLDDAYQHRYVKPGLTLLLIDYHRPVYDDLLLPAGRLREPVKGKARAQAVIITKCPQGVPAEECQRIAERLQLTPQQPLFFTTLRYGALTPLFNRSLEARPLESLKPEEQVLLLTGIASPARLVEELSKHTSAVRSLYYPDHHAFTPKDLQQIAQTFRSLDPAHRLVITTEKDATRLLDLPLSEEIKRNIYTLPIEVEFLHGQAQQFNQYITNYVRTNSRNSILLAGKNAHES